MSSLVLGKLALVCAAFTFCMAMRNFADEDVASGSARIGCGRRRVRPVFGNVPEWPESAAFRALTELTQTSRDAQRQLSVSTTWVQDAEQVNGRRRSYASLMSYDALLHVSENEAAIVYKGAII